MCGADEVENWATERDIHVSGTTSCERRLTAAAGWRVNVAVECCEASELWRIATISDLSKITRVSE